MKSVPHVLAVANRPERIDLPFLLEIRDQAEIEGGQLTDVLILPLQAVKGGPGRLVEISAIGKMANVQPRSQRPFRQELKPVVSGTGVFQESFHRYFRFQGRGIDPLPGPELPRLYERDISGKPLPCEKGAGAVKPEQNVFDRPAGQLLRQDRIAQIVMPKAVANPGEGTQHEDRIVPEKVGQRSRLARVDFNAAFFFQHCDEVRRLGFKTKRGRRVEQLAKNDSLFKSVPHHGLVQMRAASSR